MQINQTAMCNQHEFSLKLLIRRGDLCRGVLYICALTKLTLFGSNSFLSYNVMNTYNIKHRRRNRLKVERAMYDHTHIIFTQNTLILFHSKHAHFCANNDIYQNRGRRLLGYKMSSKAYFVAIYCMMTQSGLYSFLNYMYTGDRLYLWWLLIPPPPSSYVYVKEVIKL